MISPPSLGAGVRESISSPGEALRRALTQRQTIPFIGVYDVFSATLAARHYDALFVSGFSFAASFYGLPDIGFTAWSDLVAFVQRLRPILPASHHLLVDVDDGFGDVETACHVVSLLERAGASGLVLEDQKRPRRCGHFEGKQLLPLEEYVEKLTRVLRERREILVVARTDASDPAEIRTRVNAIAQAGPDAILVDAVKDLGWLRSLAGECSLPFAFNQIAGGKSPPADLRTLANAGASIIIYSTPCLFAAQTAIDAAMATLKQRNGLLTTTGNAADVKSCTAILQENVTRRSAA
jgi:2-methylisocitrate lyase-like PEP mutase family enzyme